MIILLTALVIFFTFAAFAAEWLFRSDAVFFQAIVGLLSTASGALFMKIRTDYSAPAPPLPGSTIVTDTDTHAREVVKTPPNPPEVPEVSGESKA